MSSQPNPCPQCSQPLALRVTARGSVWMCEQGCGVCLNTAVLRRNVDPMLAAQAWQAARAAARVSARRCPSCQRNLHTFRLSAEVPPLELDACVPCMVFWFDQGELGRLGAHVAGRAAQDTIPTVMPLPSPETPELVDQGLDEIVETLLTVVDGIYEKWR